MRCAGWAVVLVWGCADASSTHNGTVPDAGNGTEEGGTVDASDEACSADLASDPLNCGACGRSCGGGACEDGTCQPFEIWRSSTDDSDVTEIVSSGTSLYFVERSEYSELGASGWRFLLDGGGTQDIGRLWTSHYLGASSEDHRVYFYSGTCCGVTNVAVWDEATNALTFSGRADGADAIRNAFLARGQVFVIATAPFVTLANNEGHRTSVIRGDPEHDILFKAFGNQTEFFATGYVGSRHVIVSVPRMGEVDPLAAVNMQVVAEFPSIHFQDAIADEQWIYIWAYDAEDSDQSTISRLSVDGAETTTLAAGVTGSRTNSQVAQDNASLFWRTENAIHSIPKVGGQPRDAVQASRSISAFTLDDRFLYWVEQEWGLVEDSDSLTWHKSYVMALVK